MQDLAPVLNSPTVDGMVTVSTEADSAPVATMVKRYDGALYLFAVNMRDRPSEATFTLRDSALLEAGATTIKVIGEDRSINPTAPTTEKMSFTEAFEPYGVRLYRIE